MMIVASKQPKSFVEEILRRSFFVDVMKLMNVKGRKRHAKDGKDCEGPAKFAFGPSTHCKVLCGMLTWLISFILIHIHRGTIYSIQPLTKHLL